MPSSKYSTTSASRHSAAASVVFPNPPAPDKAVVIATARSCPSSSFFSAPNSAGRGTKCAGSSGAMKGTRRRSQPFRRCPSSVGHSFSRSKKCAFPIQRGIFPNSRSAPFTGYTHTPTWRAYRHSFSTFPDAVAAGVISRIKNSTASMASVICFHQPVPPSRNSRSCRTSMSASPQAAPAAPPHAPRRRRGRTRGRLGALYLAASSANATMLSSVTGLPKNPPPVEGIDDILPSIPPFVGHRSGLRGAAQLDGPQFPARSWSRMRGSARRR